MQDAHSLVPAAPPTYPAPKRPNVEDTSTNARASTLPPPHVTVGRSNRAGTAVGRRRGLPTTAHMGMRAKTGDTGDGKTVRLCSRIHDIFTPGFAARTSLIHHCPSLIHHCPPFPSDLCWGILLAPTNILHLDSISEKCIRIMDELNSHAFMLRVKLTKSEYIHIVDESQSPTYTSS
jgi:hypothetical protein